MPDGAQPVLDVRGLKTVFRTRAGEVHAVNDVSFHLQRGELLGVVGESGSGKSVTMMSLLRLLPSPPADIRGGMVLLVTWPLALLFPASVPFGLGQVLVRAEHALAGVLQDTPFLEWIAISRRN